MSESEFSPYTKKPSGHQKSSKSFAEIVHEVLIGWNWVGQPAWRLASGSRSRHI
jgi:hypothetical protein